MIVFVQKNVTVYITAVIIIVYIITTVLEPTDMQECDTFFTF